MSFYFPEPGEFARHEIFPGINIRTCSGEKMMVGVVEIAPNAVVEEHEHPHEQVGMILEGQVVFFIGGERKTLQAGDVYRIPGNVRHKVVGLDRPARALDIFCPVREEYR